MALDIAPFLVLQCAARWTGVQAWVDLVDMEVAS